MAVGPRRARRLPRVQGRWQPRGTASRRLSTARIIVPTQPSCIDVFTLVESLTARGHRAGHLHARLRRRRREPLQDVPWATSLASSFADDVRCRRASSTPTYGSFYRVSCRGRRAWRCRRGRCCGAAWHHRSGLRTRDRRRTVDLAQLQEAWEGGIESVFLAIATPQPTLRPSRSKRSTSPPRTSTCSAAPRSPVRVLSSPCSPATTASTTPPAPSRSAGAEADTFVVQQPLARGCCREHRRAGEVASASSQIVMIPGGFSGGDEPDGSAQVHHRVLPRSRGHRSRSRPAAELAMA